MMQKVIQKLLKEAEKDAKITQRCTKNAKITQRSTKRCEIEGKNSDKLPRETRLTNNSKKPHFLP